MQVTIQSATNVINIENFNGKLGELRAVLSDVPGLPPETRAEAAAAIEKAEGAVARKDDKGVAEHLKSAAGILESAGKAVGGATAVATAVRALAAVFGVG
jgi:hypothetical protein